MSLRDRLRKLEQRAAARRAAAAASDDAVRAARGGEDAAADFRAEGARAAASSVEERSADGVTVRTSRFPLDARHGGHALGEVVECDPRRLGLAARLACPLPANEATFLDIETTDLGGGAGGYVFQVGLLSVGRDAAVVEQALLEGPEHEAAFLEWVIERVRRAPHLVTFSGKAFDRHRLDDRAAMAGFGRPLTPLPHLDLYHVGRRLFGRRLRRTRLRNFEHELLGVHRVDDLEGAECPDAWFDWLDGHDDGRLERVFEHNLIDVLSLLALTVKVDRALAAPAHPAEAAAAGLLFRAAGAVAAAEPLLERAGEGLVPGSHRVDPDVRKAVLTRAADLRRAGRPGDALVLLERLAAAAPSDPEPLLEAAKLLEHDLRDREAALRCARELRARWMLRDGGARRLKGLEDVARRLRRLTPPDAPEPSDDGGRRDPEGTAQEA